MTQKKRNLINKLCSIYPYSESWFEAQSEKKLYAILHSYKPKKINVVKREVQLKIIDGVKYIMTDSGAWEQVID